MQLVKPDGIVGLLTPSGIYAGQIASRFFKLVSTNGRVDSLFDFENKKIFFKDVHGSFKFCAFIFGGEERSFDETKCSFFLRDTATIQDSNRCFSLTSADFARVNPNTGTAPIFRTSRDAELTSWIYEQHPVLVNRSTEQEIRVWPVKYRQGLFHSKNHSALFRRVDQLQKEGYYPVSGSRWKRGEELYLPLYEGKMVQMYDHRAASVITSESNIVRKAQPDPTLEEQYRDPSFSPRPRYWINNRDLPVNPEKPFILSFKEFTASTNGRTMIASLVPLVGCLDTLPVLLPEDDSFDASDSVCILANLNCFAYDYVTRQKVQDTHIKKYHLEQLPVITPADYDRQFGQTTARDLIRHHVLRLTYTAHDMAPFARDLGYDGPPFIWNEEERRHLRARLDALYFHLYRLSREDAAYILDTFPIVRRHDKAAFGHYRTKAMVLAYYNALAAGDTDIDVAV